MSEYERDLRVYENHLDLLRVNQPHLFGYLQEMKGEVGEEGQPMNIHPEGWDTVQLFTLNHLHEAWGE